MHKIFPTLPRRFLVRSSGKMAERAEAFPSLEGIFWVLSQIPRDRLARYEDKLNQAQQDQRICHLLRIMVLLTLGRYTEVQFSLDTLGYDRMAAHICQSHWGDSKARKANPVAPKEEAEVVLSVARIYSLLVAEKLCDPLARNEAYRAAIQAFRASQVETAQLKSILDEAQEKCGSIFTSTYLDCHFGALAMDPGTSLELPVRSDPVPIERSLDPHSLRSTGSPFLPLSHLEISPATTMMFVSDWVPSAKISQVCRLASQENDDLECPAKSPAKSSVQDEGKSIGAGNFQSHQACSTGPPQPQVTLAVEEDPQRCMKPQNTMAGEPQAIKRSSPQTLETSSTPQSSSLKPERGSPKSSEDPWVQKTEAQPQAPSSSSPHPPGSSPVCPQGPENQFFTFVVLHAGEDEAVACRVRNKLEQMGISNGATYSEDFLIPGHCQLGCFQNALENSAFTLLLLTENFKSHFCAYQTSTALMDSFHRFCKRNTVIPFVPKENPTPASKMPTFLAGLVPLDENSPVFAKRVRNTFTAMAIREKKTLWDAVQQKRERQRLQERDCEQEQMLQDFSNLHVNTQLPGPSAGIQALSGHFPPMPGMWQPPMGTDQHSLSQPFLISVGSGGPQPQFIIQNAQMIQIGDYNHMQAERVNAEEEAREN